MTQTAATLGDLQRSGRARLTAAGVDSAALDAALLLCAATGERRETVMAYPERPVESRVVDVFRAMIDRRAAREPVSRILGRREFWGLDFAGLDRLRAVAGSHLVGQGPEEALLITDHSTRFTTC